MAKFPKGRFKLEAVQPCQPFNYSFNISGYGAPLLSISVSTVARSRGTAMPSG